MLPLRALWSFFQQVAHLSLMIYLPKHITQIFNAPLEEWCKGMTRVFSRERSMLYAACNVAQFVGKLL